MRNIEGSHCCFYDWLGYRIGCYLIWSQCAVMFRQCEHHPAGCRWSCFWRVNSKAAGWIFGEQRSLHGVCFLDFPCTGNWFLHCQIRLLSVLSLRVDNWLGSLVKFCLECNFDVHAKKWHTCWVDLRISCMIRCDVAPYTMAAQRESVSCVVERVSCNECCWRTNLINLKVKSKK